MDDQEQLKKLVELLKEARNELENYVVDDYGYTRWTALSLVEDIDSLLTNIKDGT